MTESRVCLGMLWIAVALYSPVQTYGQADDAPDKAPTLQDLMERIEQLEDDKQEMADEIDELKVQLDDDWLTEERADQVRELVSDVLADADNRTSMQDGMNAGWDGNFFLQSPDGRFRLNFGGQMQIRWNWSYHDPNPPPSPPSPKYVSGFENTRTQLFFYGHVFNPDLTFRIQGNFARAGGGLGLRDAWVRYQMTNEWSILGGQYRVPFLREELVRSWNQQVVERSLVNQSLTLGLTQGVQLEFANRTIRWATSIDEGATDNVGGFGLVGTFPQNSPWSSNDTEYSVTSRFEYKIAGSWKQFKQFTSPPGEQFGLLVGFAGHVQRNNPGVPTTFKDEASWVAGTVDVSAMFGGANLFSSFTWHYIDDTNANFNVWGLVVQGGHYFTDKIEGYARLEYGRFLVDGDPFFADLAVLTIGGNYYFDGQDLKFSADIGFGINPVETDWDSDIAAWRIDQEGEEPQVVIRTQLQLLF